MILVPPDLPVGEQVFYWQQDPSKIQQGRKSAKWFKVEIISVITTPWLLSTLVPPFYKSDASKLRRPSDTADLEESSRFVRANRSTCVIAVL